MYKSRSLAPLGMTVYDNVVSSGAFPGFETHQSNLRCSIDSDNP